MRTALLLALLAGASVFGNDPPKVVPAAPLTPEEDARREAVARFALGRLRQLADRLADAEKHFRASAEAVPDSPDTLRELAKVSAALGRDPAAIRAARRVLELDPTDGDTAELLGKLLFESNQFADAGKAYRHAADAPTLADRPAARLRCAVRAAAAFDRAADPASAESALRSALKVLDDKRAALIADGMTGTAHARARADLYEKLGRALLLQRKADAATAAYETARDLCADAKQANDPAGAIRLHANLAEVFAAEKKFDKAVAEHAKYLRHGPNGVASYLRHAELLRAADPNADLVRTFARFAADNPTNPAPKWIATAALARTDFAAAHRQFRLLVATADRPDLYPILVAAYREASQAKELLAIIEEVYAAAKPSDEDKRADPAAVDRARQLTAAVKAVPALAAPLVRALAASPANKPYEVYELVVGLGMRHDMADAVAELLLTAARRNPNRKTDRKLNWLLFDTLTVQRRWRELATAAQELKKIDGGLIDTAAAAQAAIALAEIGDETAALDAIREVEGRVWTRLQTARVWSALGQPKKAVTECEDILAKDKPRGAELRSVRVAYAHALHAVKEYDKAEAELRAILADDPDDVLALNNLGYNLADQGRKLPEAEALIRRAIELDEFDRRKRGAAEPTSGTYLDSLAWVLFRRGKAADARALFETAVKTPDAARDATVWDHLGDVYFRLGEKAKAKAAWERAAVLFDDCHQGREAGRLDEVRRKAGLAK